MSDSGKSVWDGGKRVEKKRRKMLSQFAAENCRAIFEKNCSGNENFYIDLVSTQKYRKEEGRTRNHVR